MTESVYRDARSARTRRGAFVAATIAAAVLAGPVAGEPNRVDVLMSPSGSGPYLAWATIQNYAADFTDAVEPVAVETPGFTYNVRFLASSPDLWRNTVIGSGEVVEWAASEGIAPFFPEPLAAVEDFRVLGVISQSTNVFVTLDESIAEPADFAGKRVATGLLTQNEWGMHQRMLLDAWGLTPKLASFDALGPGQNIDALLDGRADVGTLVVHSALDFAYNLEPGPFKTLESSGRSWRYVSVPEAMLRDYIAESGAPFMVRKVAAGTFSNQPGELVSFGNNVLVSAHETFPEELAYAFVKMWLEMGPRVGEYSAIAQIWNPETVSAMARVAPERVHPGAMRAYREAGLTTDAAARAAQ